MIAKPPENLNQVLPIGWPRAPFWTQYRRVKRRATGNEELLSVYRDHGVILKTDRDDNFNKASEDLTTYQVVRVGDLVINKMKAWQGSVAVSGHSGIVSPAYFVFESIGTNHPEFMHYLLRSAPYVAAYAAASKGIRPSQWDLDPGVLRSFPVPVLSTAEQVRIADFLDRETAEIDAFIADQEELIALLTERRAATITHAVTKGLDPSAPMKDSGSPWMRQVPELWSVRRIGELFALIGSGTTPPRDDREFYGGDIPWVTTSELRESQIVATRETVTTAALRDLSALRVYPPGSILVAMYGATVGRLGVLGIAAATNQACCALALPRGVRMDYVYFVLRAAREHLLVIADGGGQPNINQEKLRQLRVPVPTMAEQSEIVEHLDRETAEIDATIADAREAIALSKERRAALISAAVTGKIDVRGLA